VERRRQLTFSATSTRKLPAALASPLASLLTHFLPLHQLLLSRSRVIEICERLTNLESLSVEAEVEQDGGVRNRLPLLELPPRLHTMILHFSDLSNQIEGHTIQQWYIDSLGENPHLRSLTLKCVPQQCNFAPLSCLEHLHTLSIQCRGGSARKNHLLCVLQSLQHLTSLDLRSDFTEEELAGILKCDGLVELSLNAHAGKFSWESFLASLSLSSDSALPRVRKVTLSTGGIEVAMFSRGAYVQEEEEA
jgi:hypothetical protein